MGEYGRTCDNMRDNDGKPIANGGFQYGKMMMGYQKQMEVSYFHGHGGTRQLDGSFHGKSKQPDVWRQRDMAIETHGEKSPGLTER